MKTHSIRRVSAAVNLGFQIAPMVDVVFVIMLFFMVLAGGFQVENTLNTKLPTRGCDTPTPLPDEIAIRIEDDGQVLLNDDPLDSPTSKALPELTNNLNQLRDNSRAAKAELMVCIYAAEAARYDRVIDTLDALTRAKICNVTFQAVAPD